MCLNPEQRTTFVLSYHRSMETVTSSICSFPHLSAKLTRQSQIRITYAGRTAHGNKKISDVLRVLNYYADAHWSSTYSVEVLHSNSERASRCDFQTR